MSRYGPEVSSRLLTQNNIIKAPLICHVLIIEDELLVALDLQLLLADAGATSFAFAATQEEAILEACACRPLVMTSDVRLAEGNGPATVSAIRDALGKIPVLFISGNPADCTPMEAGDPVFSKPFDRAGIVAAFRKILSDPDIEIIGHSGR